MAGRQARQGGVVGQRRCRQKCSEVATSQRCNARAATHRHPSAEPLSCALWPPHALTFRRPTGTIRPRRMSRIALIAKHLAAAFARHLAAAARSPNRWRGWRGWPGTPTAKAARHRSGNRARHRARQRTTAPEYSASAQRLSTAPERATNGYSVCAIKQTAARSLLTVLTCLPYPPPCCDA